MIKHDRLLSLPLRLVAAACLAVVCGSLVASSRGSSSVDFHPACSSPAIVAPPDRAVLMSGNLDVIYRGEDAPLKVDSQVTSWDSAYTSPVRVGHLHLSPGVHRLEIGDRRIQLCVALNEMEHDGPADWQIHKSHTMGSDVKRCAECHETRSNEAGLSVGQPRAPQACMDCHRTEEVKRTHQAFTDPPADCRQCHVLHGSPFPSLLKAPKQKILDQFAQSASRS